LAIATPVSNPAILLTNGKSRLQEQGEIENKFAGEPLGPKRGIGAVVAAV
jgi:hypothetical protein